MTRFECPYTRRLAQARDGALEAAELACVQDHLKRGCRHCQREQSYLDWLRQQLRATTPDLDEVGLQRQRRSLLFKADQYRQRLLTSRQQRLGALKGAAVAIALCAGLFMLDRTPDITINRLSGTGPIQRYTEGNYAVVELSDGGYELRVTRGVLDRSLLVRLPDGEIEDIGTVFGVTVESGRTARVAVSQGAVKLRVQGRRHVTLEAGGVWESPRQSPAVDPTEAPAEPARADDAHNSRHATASPNVERDVQPEPRVAAPLPPSSRPSTPADRGAGVPPEHPVTSRVGQRPAATRSARSSPDTSASEDALYLQILELLRQERPDAARSLAKRYLNRFPHGFRRREVAGIADAP